MLTDNDMKKHPLTTRKSFIKQSALSLLGLGLLPSVKAMVPAGRELPHAVSGRTGSEPGTLRSITYNVFNGCIGYKGINGRDLPEGEQNNLVKAARESGQIPIRIAQELALYRPDIINFAEGPDEDTVAAMAQTLGMNYAFFAGAKDGKGHFPGAVLSHFDIVDAETRPFADKNDDLDELFTRHWGKATLRLPSGKSITVHSAHLWPFAKEENDTRIRLDEIAALQAAIAQDIAGGATDVLLQGDLNHAPDTEEYRRLNSGQLVDTFTKAGQGDGFTTNAIKLTKRIDYIYCAGTLANQVTGCRTLFEGGFRMNNDDPNGFALSDHLPVMADFRFDAE